MICTFYLDVDVDVDVDFDVDVVFDVDVDFDCVYVLRLFYCFNSFVGLLVFLYLLLVFVAWARALYAVHGVPLPPRMPEDSAGYVGRKKRPTKRVWHRDSHYRS